jgi:N-[(2S)-2-amino-2-carboxyethyl]-L-glutamate dehydrogenase
MTTTAPASAPASGAHHVRVPPFAVVTGRAVQDALQGHESEVVRLVEEVYRLHDAGGTVNPPSYFLRFRDRPSDRIIALPASIGGGTHVDGLKWISSFPRNVEVGIPRASAVLVLNDHDTGYPFACMEASILSATRTAASAALAADWLSRGRGRPTRVGFVGAGLIAGYVHRYLAATGFSFTDVGLFDLSPASAEGLRAHLADGGTAATVTVHHDVETLIRSSDLVVFATVASAPHVHDATWFAHAPLVLHVSLRDLAPEVVLASANFVDDIDHCLREGTSLHLAEQLSGSRHFVGGTLADVMTGRARPSVDRPLVFSPFGLGVLDLAVGKWVYDRLLDAGDLLVVDDFFHELRRHG